jgi:hypothetical protein
METGWFIKDTRLSIELIQSLLPGDPPGGKGREKSVGRFAISSSMHTISTAMSSPSVAAGIGSLTRMYLANNNSEGVGGDRDRYSAG